MYVNIEADSHQDHFHTSKYTWGSSKRSVFVKNSFALAHTLTKIVNEVLGDHNVEKQMTDSRGDVGSPFENEVL